MSQLNLDNKPHFNGPEYDPDRDKVRLTGQIKRVFDCMSDGNWRTLDQINQETGDPHASISAQLRHLRKPRFGSHTIEREHIKNGLFKYRLLIKKQSAKQLSLV